MLVIRAPYPDPTGGGGTATTVGYSFDTDFSPAISDGTATASNMAAGPGLNEFMLFNTGGYPTQVARVTDNYTTAADAIANNAYFACTVNLAAAGRTLSRLQISSARGGASTPRSFFVRSSVDNYASDLIPPQDVPTQRPTLTPYSVTPGLVLPASFTLRFYVYTNTTNVSIEFDSIIATIN